MPARAFEAARKAGSGFSDLSIAQKVVAGLAVVALAMGGVAFAGWAATPSYAPLFSNLASSDASAIVDKLDADGVVYELTDGGQTVMVPKEDVYALRLAMSSEGLPSASDTGYALLDKQGVTTSQFQQQVTYQRALEGELSRTIRSVKGVSSAVVHLAIPKKDVFLDESEPPTASVLVDTSQSGNLTNDQVQSVVNLVASSVEGMSPQDVTLVDQAGQLLSAPGEGTAAGGVQGDRTAEYEQRVARSVQGILDTVLGPGRAVARVTAELDFDAVDRTSERFVAEDPLASLAESTTTETYTGGVPNAAGVLGPDNVLVPAGGTGGDYSKETRDVTPAVGKVTERTVAAPGTVRRQSVAVVLDERSAGAVDRDELTAMVSAAAGVVPDRDVVAVSVMAFDNAAADQAQAQLDAATAAEEAARKAELLETAVLAGLVLLIVLLVLIASWRRRRRRAVPQDVELEDFDAGFLEALPAEAVEPDLALAALPPAVPDAHTQLMTARREEVAALVERQPEEVADLLRGWLADRRS